MSSKQLKLALKIGIKNVIIFSVVFLHMSPIMRKPTFCTCEKDAAQLHSNCEVDQRLCFSYTDSKIPLLSKSKISSSELNVQLGLCWTCWFSHTMALNDIHVHCMPRTVHRKSVQSLDKVNFFLFFFFYPKWV